MKKSKMLPIIPVVSFALGLHATDFSATHTLNSAYVFRGLVVNDEMVYQPYVDFSNQAGLYGWFWGNMDLTDNRGYPQYEFSECDLGIGYGRQIGRLNLGLEYAEYFYPSVSLENTRELFLRLNYDILLQPTITITRDVGEVDGFYVMVSFSQNLAIREDWSLDATASLGWADSDYLAYYFGHDESSALDGNLEISASKTFSNGISISASIHYTWITGGDALASQARSWYEYDHLIWGGVTLSHSF